MWIDKKNCPYNTLYQSPTWDSEFQPTTPVDAKILYHENIFLILFRSVLKYSALPFLVILSNRYPIKVKMGGTYVRNSTCLKKIILGFRIPILHRYWVSWELKDNEMESLQMNA